MPSHGSRRRRHPRGLASLPVAFVELVEACLSLDREGRPTSVETIGATIAATEYVPRDSPLPRTVRSVRTPTVTPTSSALTMVNTETAIAVLPFQCAPGDEYLADGLVDDLIDTLSTTATLRVRPAGMLRAVSAQDPSLAQYGALVEARFAVWTGDVVHAGLALERVRSRIATGSFDLLAIYHRWRTTGEFDIAPWHTFVASIFGAGRPQRPQLATLQRFAEVAAGMHQDAATELVLRAAANGGLLDAVWLDGMPLFRRIAHLPWFADVRAQVAARAARVLAAFRSAASGATAP